jgi:peroxiredoxin
LRSKAEGSEALKVNSIVARFIGQPTILAAIALLFGCALAQPDHALREGDRAPTFSISTDQGKRINTNAPGDSILALNFWETSCIPCVAELPSLSAFERKFRSKHVIVLAVSGDEDSQKYGRFLRDHQIVLDTYRDPARSISKSFGTFMFPETYIIQRGRIIRKVVGGIDWMNDDISSFIGKRLAP